jgi:hypothetical protein
MRGLRENERNQSAARNIEMTRTVNAAFNRKLAEASFLVGKEFMESEKVPAMITDAVWKGITKNGAMLDEEDMEALTAKITESLENAIEEAVSKQPTQFVQNVFSPDGSLSASEIYRQTHSALSLAGKVRVDLDVLDHQSLGAWASANDCVRLWQWDTQDCRNYLKNLQDNNQLVRPTKED